MYICDMLLWVSASGLVPPVLVISPGAMQAVGV